MKECVRTLVKYDVSCPCEDCRLWIDYEEDLNCTIVAVEKTKCMTLREVADRMGISFVRVKQIQDVGYPKLLKKLNDKI